MHVYYTLVYFRSFFCDCNSGDIVLLKREGFETNTVFIVNLKGFAAVSIFRFLFHFPQCYLEEIFVSQKKVVLSPVSSFQ